MVRRQGTDALDYVLKLLGIDFKTSQLKGPMSFMFNPNLDEDTKLLVQAFCLLLVLSLVYFLDKSGAFAHIKSQRTTVPPLLVAVCHEEDASQVQEMAERRGVVDDALTANEEIAAEETEALFVPRRGDRVEIVVNAIKLAGVVLEAGVPRASARGRRDWTARWGDLPCTIALLPGGDAVLSNLCGRDNVSGLFLRWRFPRFLRKAFRRRTNLSEPSSTTVTFFSSGRNVVIGVAPLSRTYGNDVLKALPELEGENSKSK